MLLAVLYKKRLEVRVLADLRSFRLRKNILLQIKIRRSTAVGRTPLVLVGVGALVTLSLIVLFEILHLVHHLFENLRAVLRRITVFDKTNLNIKFQLVTDILIIEPIRKG